MGVQGMALTLVAATAVRASKFIWHRGPGCHTLSAHSHPALSEGFWPMPMALSSVEMPTEALLCTVPGWPCRCLRHTPA